MTTAREQEQGQLAAVSSAMVHLHKEQFGRGPTRARTNWAGDDVLICVLEDALLPAEQALVEMGDAARVRETRMSFQVATQTQFRGSVEAIVGREIRAFTSATDAEQAMVFEVFVFTSAK